MAQLDWTRIRALFIMRGKLTWRQFTRQKGRILIASLVLFIFGPMVVGAAVGTYFGYTGLPEPWAGGLLGGVLVGMWLIWMLFPVFFAELNEGADITRLLIYPLRQPDLLVSIFIGTLFDYPTYLLLPLLTAVLLAWGLGPALPVVSAAIILAYLHMIVGGQLVGTGLGGILKSRRFRDVMLVVGPVIGSSCYFLGQGIEAVGEWVNPDSLVWLETWRPLDTLRWLPPGAAAEAIVSAAGGAWLSAGLWLLYSAGWLAVLTAVWWRLLNRLTTGQGFLFNAGVRPAETQKETAGPRPPVTVRGVPDTITAVFIKEVRSAWRIPARRVALVQSVFFPLLMLAVFFFSGDSTAELPTDGTGGYLLPPLALFSFWVVSNNILAWEGHGITTLLLFPTVRHHILLGKTAAIFLLGGGPFLLLGLIFLALVPTPQTAVSLLTGLAAGLVVTAVNAIVSILFPIRLNIDSPTASNPQSGRGGCISQIGQTMLGPAIVGGLTTPLAVPLGVGYWLEAGWVPWAGLLLTVPYAAAVYWFGIRWAGTLMVEYEAQIFEALHQSEVPE